jgi:hypothetical protein
MKDLTIEELINHMICKIKLSIKSYHTQMDKNETKKSAEPHKIYYYSLCSKLHRAMFSKKEKRKKSYIGLLKINNLIK